MKPFIKVTIQSLSDKVSVPQKIIFVNTAAVVPTVNLPVADKPAAPAAWRVVKTPAVAPP